MLCIYKHFHVLFDIRAFFLSFSLFCFCFAFVLFCFLTVRVYLRRGNLNTLQFSFAEAADIVPDHSLQATVNNFTSSSTVTLSWLSPAIVNGKILYYVLQCTDAQGVSKQPSIPRPFSN